MQEAASSPHKARPQFESVIETLKESDKIVFTTLDRDFRNQRKCINTLNDLQEKGIDSRTMMR